MKLPMWAKPLDSKTVRYCECDDAYLAVCVVKLPFMGRTLTFRLCPACIVFERAIRQEITYRQEMRWVTRLRPLLTVQRDTVRAEQKAKAAAAKETKKKAAAEREAARLKALHARKRDTVAA